MTSIDALTASVINGTATPCAVELVTAEQEIAYAVEMINAEQDIPAPVAISLPAKSFPAPVAPSTPVSAPQDLLAPSRPSKRRQCQIRRGQNTPAPKRTSMPTAPAKPTAVARILACWPLPDGNVTSSWRDYCLANLSPADADDPAKTRSLPARADIKGPFFPIGRQLYTKDFHKFLLLQFDCPQGEEEKKEYDTARRMSSIKCDCCYHRSINQAVAAMSSRCPLCRCPTPKCDSCREFSLFRIQNPDVETIFTAAITHCPQCKSSTK